MTLLCGWAVLKAGVMQTLAQSGSIKTGLFHGLHQPLTHAVNPPDYEEKAGNEHTALLQVG